MDAFSVFVPVHSWFYEFTRIRLLGLEEMVYCRHKIGAKGEQVPGRYVEHREVTLRQGTKRLS